MKAEYATTMAAHFTEAWSEVVMDKPEQLWQP